MDKCHVSVEVPIAKVDREERIIYGVVYKAAQVDDNGKPLDGVDTQGNWMLEAEVKKACHNFNRKLQTPAKKKVGVDKQHNEVPGYGIVLESYIAKSDIPEIDAAPGDWVAAVQIVDDVCWKEIEKGAITGFSIGGRANIKESQEGGE